MMDAAELAELIKDNIQAATGGTLPSAALLSFEAISSAVIDAIAENAAGGGGVGSVTLVDTGAGLTGGPITTTGTIEVDPAVLSEIADAASDAAAASSDAATALALAGAAVPPTRQIIAGTGLDGGGDLSANRTLEVEPAILAAVAAAVPNTRTISAGTGLTGGGDLSANRSLALDAATQAVLAAAVPNTRQIITGAGLSGGGDLSANRTIKAALAASQRVLGRNTAGAGDAEEVTAPQILDWIGATQGQILYRGASAWSPLAPGTAGHVLTSGGAGADPAWAAAGGASPSLSLADAAAPATLNLTTEGTIDWVAQTATNAHLYLVANSTLNAKAKGGRRLANGHNWIFGAQNVFSASTSTGDPVYSATATDVVGINTIASVNNGQRYSVSSGIINWGFGFLLPAFPTARTLRVYWANGTGTGGTVTITATLSDGTTQTTTHNGAGAVAQRKTTITFAALGQEMYVSFIVTAMNAGGGNLSFHAATLA